MRTPTPTPAGDLRPGDTIRTKHGHTIRVAAVERTGRMTTYTTTGGFVVGVGSEVDLLVSRAA
jgi:sulfite exporter TauE/SafE